MYSVSGISGAGPIFRDIMLALEVKNKNYEFPFPQGLERKTVCSRSGKLPNKYCSERMEEIYIKGTSPKKACDIHRLYRIDTRNGLIASKDCPRQFADSRIFEIYPPEYYSWAVDSEIELPPSEISDISPVYADGIKEVSFDIESPQDGDVFRIDPVLRREYQSITLIPKIDDSVESIKWFIDEKAIRLDEYPFTAQWQIEQGKHNINFVAVKKDGNSARSRNIEVTVVD
jgi:penicillin-binding protein 1C